jgi:hypothetical protein
VVSFVVRRPLRDFLTIVHSGLKRRESELSFEDTARGEELLVIPRRRVNPKGLRVDLVDGYMNVLVVFVVVTRGDVLVPRKPQRLHQVFDNTPELVPVEAPVFRVKGDDHVIRAVAARAGVLRVQGLDESARELEVAGPGHARKIGG